MSIINIGLHGSSGRMGAAVTEAIARQKAINLIWLRNFQNTEIIIHYWIFV